jgi:hypothetical protein
MQNAKALRDIQQQREYNGPAFCMVHWRAGCGESPQGRFGKGRLEKGR